MDSAALKGSAGNMTKWCYFPGSHAVNGDLTLIWCNLEYLTWFLPPVSEGCGKVMFLHLSVCSQGGEVTSCPGPLRAVLSRSCPGGSGHHSQVTLLPWTRQEGAGSMPLAFSEDFLVVFFWLYFLVCFFLKLLKFQNIQLWRWWSSSWLR